MTGFVHVDPAVDAYWRAIILFGRNVASYKFALGKALLQLASRGATEPTLGDLAPFFADNLCAHLKDNDKQGTSRSSQFLDACRAYIRGSVSRDELMEATVRRGFVNVVDAFHVVGQGEVKQRFFHDARRDGNRIVLTDEMLRLATSREAASLGLEVEARWRLVETAWNIGVSPHLLDVSWDSDHDRLFVTAERRRHDVTSAREALNGYQRGRCFYCFGPVSAEAGSSDLADVDHYFPRRLAARLAGEAHLDGVWNLVLCCGACNRGSGGKFDRVASLNYLERLERRNNYLIGSHHPLRETLMQQTGSTEQERRRFLQAVDRRAVELLAVSDSGRWVTPMAAPKGF